MTPLNAEDVRWIAWRNEKRGKDGKPTKVPYGRGGRPAKADDESTWLARADAEILARRLVNGQVGGIGYELGDIGSGLFIAGIDLDSCLSNGELAPWAATILALAGTYAETSPSGNGVKAFFCLAAEEVRAFLGRIGVPASGWGCRRGIPGEDARDHGPAIEVYCKARYFAVTENRWPGVPDTLRVLDRADLEQLAALVPPAKPMAGSGKAAGDNSRSAAAFRKGGALRREGNTFEEMCEALRTDPETAEWFKEKGDQRQLRRIWDKAAPDSDGLPTITVRAGLRHEAADAGIAALEAAGTAFYQRGEQIVRVFGIPAKTADGSQTVAPGIVPVSHAALGRELGRAARWAAFDRKGAPVRIDPPRPVVEQIAEMSGEWPFPVLAGVIGTPTMRGDGSLLLDEGYDEQTGLVLLGAPVMPQIPERPTQADAERALLLLDGLLDEFPFKDGGTDSVDRAVALSELLTPVLRGAMPTAPMHLANAPQPGTGKSYLADLASCIAIARNRGTYIAAALTIGRAYFCAGKPGRLSSLASYEAWSDLVRSPLVWLGRADPVASMASLRSVDPVRLARAAVFRAWADELGINGAHLTADIVNRANDQGTSGAHVRPSLHAVLLEICRDRVGNIDATRVGKWLSRNENIVADGFKLTCDRGDAARPRWVLRKT